MERADYGEGSLKVFLNFFGDAKEIVDLGSAKMRNKTKEYSHKERWEIFIGRSKTSS